MKRVGWVTQIIAAILLLGSQALANSPPPQEAYARVMGGAGQLQFAGKTITVGESIQSEGIFETTADGSAIIRFKGKATDLTVGPKTKVQIIRPDPSSPKAYEILQGICRWNVSKTSKPTKWLKISTRSAVMGVRGTDFYATYFPLLNESEVVVFEGNVDFANATNLIDTKNVPAGHWGGVGGRYGKKIGDLISLPPSILTELKRQVDVKVSVQEGDSSGSAH